MVSGADGKQKSLRIARVHPIARRAAELLPRDRRSLERSGEETMGQASIAPHSGWAGNTVQRELINH